VDVEVDVVIGGQLALELLAHRKRRVVGAEEVGV